ncbi:uncharacterized protein LOC134536945 [Bacillus rossius redtenbacheri]|uniref:uncharacterized protein LOC134536945 n=1 Tax=Bacillus rossius redtenbacheri TaxID=93214 RepID=UPI002FDE3E17
MRLQLATVVCTTALLAAVRAAVCLPREYECSLDSRSMWRGYEGNQLDADDFQAFMELVSGGRKPARSVDPEPPSCSREQPAPASPEPESCARPRPPVARGRVRDKGRGV